MRRGEIWWADLPDPVASEPGYRRPDTGGMTPEVRRGQVFSEDGAYFCRYYLDA